MSANPEETPYQAVPDSIVENVFDTTDYSHEILDSALDLADSYWSEHYSERQPDRVEERPYGKVGIFMDSPGHELEPGRQVKLGRELKREFHDELSTEEVTDLVDSLTTIPGEIDRPRYI